MLNNIFIENYEFMLEIDTPEKAFESCERVLHKSIEKILSDSDIDRCSDNLKRQINKFNEFQSYLKTLSVNA
jgi:hypothetical protein